MKDLSTVLLLLLIASQTQKHTFAFSHSNIWDVGNKNNQETFTGFIFLISLSECIHLSKHSCAKHATQGTGFKFLLYIVFHFVQNTLENGNIFPICAFSRYCIFAERKCSYSQAWGKAQCLQQGSVNILYLPGSAEKHCPPTQFLGTFSFFRIPSLRTAPQRILCLHKRTGGVSSGNDSGS